MDTEGGLPIVPSSYLLIHKISIIIIIAVYIGLQTQASSQNGRALAVVPTQAQCEIEFSLTTELLCRFVQISFYVFLLPVLRLNITILPLVTSHLSMYCNRYYCTWVFFCLIKVETKQRKQVGRCFRTPQKIRNINVGSVAESSSKYRRKWHFRVKWVNVCFYLSVSCRRMTNQLSVFFFDNLRALSSTFLLIKW